MKSYRYQLTKRADFEAFVVFLIDNKINFTTQHSYSPSSADHIYHITVTPEEESLFENISAFLTTLNHCPKVEDVNNLYNDAKDACNDPYCDSVTLRSILSACLEENRNINENHDSVYEELKKQVEAERKDKVFYQNHFCKTLTENNRVKEQIQAVAVIIDSIFPKN